MALEAKEKGNAAFKTGDFPAAIGHYTAAILADPKDATFPLNRAAAYLKLGKHKDAERDCTTVLSLDSKNVKAFFRRGQARLGLGLLDGAKSDLKAALSAEPNNLAIQSELSKAEAQIPSSKSSTRKQPVEIVGPPLDQNISSTPKRRRRIPITIVEPANMNVTDGVRSANDVSITAVSSRPIRNSQESLPNAGPSINHVIVPVPDPSPTFKEAKKAREVSKGVGGGIFRPSGRHTVVSNSGQLASSESKPTSQLPGEISSSSSWLPKHPMSESEKPPMSSVMFLRSWDSLKAPDKRWKLLNQIPPPSIPVLFQTTLEAGHLASIAQTLLAVMDVAASDPAMSSLRGWVHAYMTHLARVPRFTTITLFLSPSETGTIREVLSALDACGMATEGWDSVRNRL